MLNDFKSLMTLLQSYLTWIVDMSAGEIAAYILFLFFALFVMLEFCFPREQRLSGRLLRSYRANIELFAFNSLAMTLLSIPSLLVLAEKYSDKGLLNYIANPIMKAAFAFLALDLLLYIWHKASHRFDCLWMFHKVHHNDPYLNVSTAFRAHFLEILIINFIKAMLIVVLGIQEALVLANETILIFFTMLHHAHISFRGERLLGRIVITPYLHRVHHSVKRSEHDRNYGSVLSLWDRLFGTLVELKPAEIGIKGGVPKDLVGLVKCGFTMTGRSPAQSNDDVLVAGAACYKAEKRGFYFRDWQAAKHAIK
ncbi:MAG: sterol desaturase family protein [Methylobacter sp.]